MSDKGGFFKSFRGPRKSKEKLVAGGAEFVSAAEDKGDVPAAEVKGTGEAGEAPATAGPAEASEQVDGDTATAKGPNPAKVIKPVPLTATSEKLTKVKAPTFQLKKKPKEEEEVSLPLNVAVDFYRGVTREREAEQLARAFVEKNFDAPNASYIHVQRWRDGCAVEVQEGGGRAYLPEVLAKLDEDEEAVIALPMSGRILQVRLDTDTKTLEALVLTAGQLPTADAFVALPTKPMSPIDKRGSKVFIAGLGMLGASMIALVFSVGAFFIDTSAWSLPYLQQTRVQDLPSAQTKKILAVLETSDCVAKMEFSGGQWSIVPGWDNGSGLCTSVGPVYSEPQIEPPMQMNDPSLEGNMPMPMPGDPSNGVSAPPYSGPAAPQP